MVAGPDGCVRFIADGRDGCDFGAPRRRPRKVDRDVKPDLDYWLPEFGIRIAHRRESSAPPDRLWEAAREVRLADAGMLGRLIRWRIPGLPAGISFAEMFRRSPFIPLVDDAEGSSVSGIVGRIWTLRRDYPELDGPDDFRSWSASGTARVLFANWVEPADRGASAALASEVRVQAIGAQGRLGVAAVAPLTAAFQGLIGSEGIAAAVRRAER